MPHEIMFNSLVLKNVFITLCPLPGSAAASPRRPQSIPPLAGAGTPGGMNSRSQVHVWGGCRGAANCTCCLPFPSPDSRNGRLRAGRRDRDIHAVLGNAAPREARIIYARVNIHFLRNPIDRVDRPHRPLLRGPAHGNFRARPLSAALEIECKSLIHHMKRLRRGPLTATGGSVAGQTKPAPGTRALFDQIDPF